MKNTPFHSVGSGPTTLHFAHANGFAPKVYTQFLTQLGTQHSVVSVHHRPLWQTEIPSEETDLWRMTAHDMIKAFDRQGWRGVIGVGHSLGAVATMYAALERPELFSHLVLLEPVFLPPEFIAFTKSDAYDPSNNPMVKAARRRRDRWESREAAWERFRPKPNFARFSDAALWDYVNHAIHIENNEAVLTWSKEWESRFYSIPALDVWDHIANITHPTLAIRASDTDTVFPQAWELWQQIQPSATFKQMENVGHLLMLEEPEATANLIIEWLSDV